MLMPGWEWVGATGGGSAYANDLPDKIVLHSTEGGSAAGAIAAYRNHGAWPHFTIDYWANRAIQHLDTDVAASALYNTRSTTGYEPNRSGKVLQVEIVGFANDIAGYPEVWYRWVASKLGPIAQAHGIPNKGIKCYGQGSGFILASGHSPIRLSQEQFNSWNGWLAHQHVGDGNDHWDAPFRMGDLLTFIYGGARIYDPLAGTWSVQGSDDIEFSPGTWTGEGDDELDANEKGQLAAIFNWMQQLCGWQAEITTLPTGQIATVDAQGRPVSGGIKVPTVVGNIMEAATSVRPNGMGTLEQRIAAQVAQAIGPKLQQQAAATSTLDDAALQRLAALISDRVEDAAAAAAADIIRQLLVPPKAA